MDIRLWYHNIFLEKLMAPKPNTDISFFTHLKKKIYKEVFVLDKK